MAQKYGCKVTGVDISSYLNKQAKSLARAKGLSAQVEFLICDAQALPFEDNTFDVAVPQAMLVLVEDKVKAIKEAWGRNPRSSKEENTRSKTAE